MVKLFDEEGSVSVRGKRVRCLLAMPDEKEITQFAEAVKCGHITKQDQYYRTLYVWSVEGVSAINFIKTALPFLTGARKEQCAKVGVE